MSFSLVPKGQVFPCPPLSVALGVGAGHRCGSVFCRRHLGCTPGMTVEGDTDDAGLRQLNQLCCLPLQASLSCTGDTA